MDRRDTVLTINNPTLSLPPSASSAGVAITGSVPLSLQSGKVGGTCQVSPPASLSALPRGVDRERRPRSSSPVAVVVSDVSQVSGGLQFPLDILLPVEGSASTAEERRSTTRTKAEMKEVAAAVPATSVSSPRREELNPPEKKEGSSSPFSSPKKKKDSSYS